MAEIAPARPLSGPAGVCVLKRLLPQFSRDLQFASMFIDEARITIGLHHDNVLRLYDFGQVDGVYFMAIESIDRAGRGARQGAYCRRSRPPDAASTSAATCGPRAWFCGGA
ncbi:MAG: hypothetical protein FJ137_14205 [Deltaproteobacteria bacterium]|nr:hypothetical protein [Deltaproteobacteria bacterium]